LAIQNLSDSTLNWTNEITQGNVEIKNVMNNVYTISVDAKYFSGTEFLLEVEHDFSL